MKRDITWLKESIGELPCVDTVFNSEGSSYIDSAVPVMAVYDLIDQLDEPEVLSQEWIDKHKVSRISNLRKMTMSDVVPVDKLQDLLVPKQEELESKIKVLIEAYKQEDGAYSNPENGWISGFVEDLENLVEEELLYYAKLKEIKPPENEWLTNLSGPNYYVLDKEGLMLGEFVLNLVGMKTEASTYTLKDWERHGINDSNADFVKVDE